ncbi:MAG: hypothetical protein IT310_01735 [Anaerolineales bacterium]|nr:hypothetical protein [Anaerolineales bacterium]
MTTRSALPGASVGVGEMVGVNVSVAVGVMVAVKTGVALKVGAGAEVGAPQAWIKNPTHINKTNFRKATYLTVSKLDAEKKF